MLVKIPKYIVKDNRTYRLYLNYASVLKPDVWVWTVAYVSDYGLLDMGIGPDTSLQKLEMSVLEWLKTNNLQTE